MTRILSIAVPLLLLLIVVAQSENDGTNGSTSTSSSTGTFSSSSSSSFHDDDGDAQSCDANVTCAPNFADIFEDPLKFLKEQVFGQKSAEPSDRFLSMLQEHDDETTAQQEKNRPFFGILDQMVKTKLFPDQRQKELEKQRMESTSLVQQLLERAAIMRQEEAAVEGLDLLNRIAATLKEASEQLRHQFGDVLESLDGFFPLAMIYFLQSQAARFNPIWKRRMHRFFNQVTKKELVQLHDALFLSTLAYVDTVDHFRQGLSKFDSGDWELMFGTTTSLPNLPANFLIIHKELAPLGQELPWKAFFNGKQETEVVVVLVVRGTKDLADALSDSLLKPQEYKGGFAHGGILDSGKNLAAYYLPKLKEIHQATGEWRTKIIVIVLILGIRLWSNQLTLGANSFLSRTRQGTGDLHGS